VVRSKIQHTAHTTRIANTEVYTIRPVQVPIHYCLVSVPSISVTIRNPQRGRNPLPPPPKHLHNKLLLHRRQTAVHRPLICLPRIPIRRVEHQRTPSLRHDRKSQPIEPCPTPLRTRVEVGDGGNGALSSDVGPFGAAGGGCIVVGGEGCSGGVFC